MANYGIELTQQLSTQALQRPLEQRPLEQRPIIFEQMGKLWEKVNKALSDLGESYQEAATRTLLTVNKALSDLGESYKKSAVESAKYDLYCTPGGAYLDKWRRLE